MPDDKLLAMSRWITSRRRLRALAGHMDYDENLRSVSDMEEAAMRMFRSWLLRQSHGKSAFRNLYQALKDKDMEWLLQECFRR